MMLAIFAELVRTFRQPKGDAIAGSMMYRSEGRLTAAEATVQGSRRDSPFDQRGSARRPWPFSFVGFPAAKLFLSMLYGSTFLYITVALSSGSRSEERRVGKECRSRWR